MSFIERAQKESEELVKNMGGSLEIEGGRRTRSSARGTPTRATAVSTPPPAKKARTSPANAGSTPSRGRGRGRKIDISEESEEAKEVAEIETGKKSEKGKTPEKAKNHEKVKTPEKTKTPVKKELSPDQPNNTTKEAAPSVAKSAKVTEVAEKSNIDENKDETDASLATNKLTDDKADGTADIEAIPVEKHNNDQQVTSKAVVEETPAGQKTNVSSMETDDELQFVETAQEETQREIEEVPTAATAETTLTIATEEKITTEVVKLLTPEPMDVDSNSKSSDVELIESTPPDITSGALAPAQTANENTVVQAKVLDVDVVDADTEVNVNNIDSTQIVAADDATAKPVVPAVGNVEKNSKRLNNVENIAKIESVTGVAASSEANEVNANNDGTVKPDNELCVPKVVSPSINNANNDGTVTTIL
ncbi:neurofilament heavy polypeptide isoform X2 [Eurosta solidaginis]